MKLFFERFLPRFDKAGDQGATDVNLTDGEENPFDGGASFDDLMSQLDEAEGGSVFDRMHREAKADQPDEAEDVDENTEDDLVGEGEEVEAEEAGTAEEVAEEETAETAPKAKLDFSEIEALLPPGSVIESMEDLTEHIGRYRESHEMVSKLDALVSSDEHLQTYLTEIHRGTDSRIAAIKAFGDLAKVPDPDEDPEAYAEWKSEQKAQRVRSEYEQRAQQDQQGKIQQIAKQASDVFDTTVKRIGLSEDDSKSLAHLFQSLTQGDPVTGRFRRDAFEILHNGRQFADVQKSLEGAVEKAQHGNMKDLAAEATDHALVKQVKKAIRDAFIAGGKQAGKAKSDIPGTPDLSGSRGGGDLSPKQKEVREFARSLQTDNWWDDPVIKGN